MSHPIRRLAVRNYKSLRDVDVRLQPLSVLVGPNGAGKSNFLDAIRFLGDVARFDLREALSDRGGFDTCLYKGDDLTYPWIRFSVEARITSFGSDNAPDEYDLGIQRIGGNTITRDERVVFKNNPGSGRRRTYHSISIELGGEDSSARVSYLKRGKKFQAFLQPLSAESTILSTFQRLGSQEGAKQVQQMADLFESFRVFDVEVRYARGAVPYSPAELPLLSDDADNLTEFLFLLREQYEDTFERLCRDMRSILPGFRGIVFEPLGRGLEGFALKVREAGLSTPMPLESASYGTVRGLALLALLHDPHPPQVTGVEEIDHGLHPYALDVLVERMREASERTQLLVATHSPTLVSRLHYDELVICERDAETGATTMSTLEEDKAKEMERVSGLNLGELWFSGVLGGVPQ